VLLGVSIVISSHCFTDIRTLTVNCKKKLISQDSFDSDEDLSCGLLGCNTV
jgi:hypothetical protein